MSLARRVFPMILALALTCVAGRETAAHALVVESSPTVDGSVRGPEIEIALRTKERVSGDDQARSRVAGEARNGALDVGFVLRRCCD